MTDNSSDLDAPTPEPKTKKRRKRRTKKQIAAEREKAEKAKTEAITVVEETNYIVSEPVMPSEQSTSAFSNFWEKRKILIEVAAVLAIFLTAIFALGQQHVMQNMLENMQANQRPWVGLNGITPIDQSSAVLFQIINSGHAPAMNMKVKISYHVENGQLLQLPATACTDDCTFRGIQLLPNVPLTVRLPKAEEPLIPEGLPIWYIARVDYDDASGKHHKTGICLIKKDADTRACPITNSNYAD
jgi:hypothetical protein